MDTKRTIGILSDLTYRVYVATALAEPLVQKERRPVERSLRRLGGVCAGLLVSSVVKRLIPERRPDGSDNRSFPSGHSVVTMATAQTAAMQEPRRAALWYAGAALETALRALSRKHHVRDVVAGGALGYLLARQGQQLLAPAGEPSETGRSQGTGAREKRNGRGASRRSTGARAIRREEAAARSRRSQEAESR